MCVVSSLVRATCSLDDSAQSLTIVVLMHATGSDPLRKKWSQDKGQARHTISNMSRCGTTRQLLHDNQQKTVTKPGEGGLRKHQKTEAHTQSTEHRFSMTQFFLKESEGRE